MIAGAVVGGVSLVALVIAVVFFLRKRRRQRAQDVPPAASPPERKYTDDVPKASPMELSATSDVSELPIKQENSELSGHDARYDTVELDASTTLQDPRKYSVGNTTS